MPDKFDDKDRSQSRLQSDLDETTADAGQEGTYDHQLSFATPNVEAPAPIKTVRKRDGREAPFEGHKITDAILQAARSAGQDTDHERARNLMYGVALYLSKRTPDGIPTVEQIGDAVERVLIELGHPATALAYVRYRDKRSRLRRLRDGDLQVLLQELEEARRAEADGKTPPALSMFVRTSDDSLVQWDREKIVAALLREANMDRAMAELIAAEVEAQVSGANLRTLTAALVRELVDAKLIEHGLEEHRRKHMRLGVPLYDAERIICVPNQGESEYISDPRTSAGFLAARVKKEYALCQVFSEDVAEAHAAGDIHLHDLGQVDCLRRCQPLLRAFTEWGLPMPDGRDQQPMSAYSFNSLAGHFTEHLERFFTQAVQWDSYNLFMAPFLAELDEQSLSAVSDHLAAELATHNGGKFRTRIGLNWNMTEHIGGLSVPDPEDDDSDELYGAYEDAAQTFALQMLRRQAKASETNSMSAPGCVVTLDRLFFSNSANVSFLLDTSQSAIGAKGMIIFFDRHEDTPPPEEPAAAWSAGVAATVSINLARLAYRAEGGELALFDALERLVQLAARAHSEKRDFLHKLLKIGDLGPLAWLARRHDGRMIFDFDSAEYEIGVVGLNECVHYLTGLELHSTMDVLDLGKRILHHVRAMCDTAAFQHNMSLVPVATDEPAVARRFAETDYRPFAAEARRVVKYDPITQDLNYTPGVNFAHDARLTPMERVRGEGHLHTPLGGTPCSTVVLPELETSARSVADFVRKAFLQTSCRGLAFVHNRPL